MEITQEHASRIEELMAGLECPKEFICYKSGFTHLCRVRKTGTRGFLECLDSDSRNCQFSLPFNDPPACLCPVRIYLAAEFGK
ncbi:MAG: hypothetical protein A2Y77_06405 [Planctomycetes bacterium RBG_13_62_9]|nr:MAG: hypothetical protein A2Y77_06405 [Planctomycetes bacterium RBG_13_62_9]